VEGVVKEEPKVEGEAEKETAAPAGKDAKK
jgi:hypothetical protein